MQNQEISRQLQKLNQLIKDTQKACGEQIELQNEWATYLCIVSAGLIENALHEIYTDYVKQSSSGPVTRFALCAFNKISNPKTKTFVEVARIGKEEWARDLENYVGEKGRKEAIDTIMNNRHQIAHGKNSSITVSQINDYLKRSVEVLDFIEQQCL